MENGAGWPGLVRLNLSRYNLPDKTIKSFGPRVYLPVLGSVGLSTGRG